MSCENNILLRYGLPTGVVTDFLIDHFVKPAASRLEVGGKTSEFQGNEPIVPLVL